MINQILFLKNVSSTIDARNGIICIKGIYAEETKELNPSWLIPYLTRDIFLTQKSEPLLKVQITFKVIYRANGPLIRISLPKGIPFKSLKKIQSHLVQILWKYNFIIYDAKTDRYQQRFSYEFLFYSESQSLPEAA
jgi:hypothetical protein